MKQYGKKLNLDDNELVNPFCANQQQGIDELDKVVAYFPQEKPSIEELKKNDDKLDVLYLTDGENNNEQVRDILKSIFPSNEPSEEEMEEEKQETESIPTENMELIQPEQEQRGHVQCFRRKWLKDHLNNTHSHFGLVRAAHIITESRNPKNYNLPCFMNRQKTYSKFHVREISGDPFFDYTHRIFNYMPLIRNRAITTSRTVNGLRFYKNFLMPMFKIRFTSLPNRWFFLCAQRNNMFHVHPKIRAMDLQDFVQQCELMNVNTARVPNMLQEAQSLKEVTCDWLRFRSSAAVLRYKFRNNMLNQIVRYFQRQDDQLGIEENADLFADGDYLNNELNPIQRTEMNFIMARANKVQLEY